MLLDSTDLALVELGLEYAIDHIHNEIAMCPDVRYFAEDIAEYRAQVSNLADLLERVRIATGYYA